MRFEMTEDVLGGERLQSKVSRVSLQTHLSAQEIEAQTAVLSIGDGCGKTIWNHTNTKVHLGSPQAEGMDFCTLR